MHYKGGFVSLGRTGLKVSRIAFGCGFRGLPDEKDAQRTIEQAMDSGINFFDCANRYECADKVKAETVLGRAMKHRRDEFVITSKVGTIQNDGPNGEGLSRAHILQEIEHTLQRLQTDHVDIYILHLPDETTDLEETLRAIELLCQQGKTRYVGMSNYRAWQVVEALGIQRRLNAQPLSAVQNPYGLLNRSLEEDMFPVCRKHGIGILTYNVLGAGLLGGRYGRDLPMPEGSFWSKSPLYRAYFPYYFQGQVVEIVELVRRLSEKYGVSMCSIATAWVLSHQEITAVIAGANHYSQFEDYLSASELQLEKEDLEALDLVSYGTREEFLLWSVEKNARRLGIQWQ